MRPTKQTVFESYIPAGSRSERIVKAIKEGMSDEELAKRFNTGRKTAAVYRRALNGELGGGEKHTWNWHGPEFYRGIGKMIEQGLTPKQIAEKLHVQRNQGYTYVRKYKAMKAKGEL